MGAQGRLGHASIQLTVDTYRRWLPMGNKAAVNRLDEATAGASDNNVVANGVFGGTCASEPADLCGAGGGSRTRELRITNPGGSQTEQHHDDLSIREPGDQP